jgi:uncharacterized coiled-coil protein SlyX
MLLLALAGVANEQQQIAALQEQVAAQQAQMAALQAQVAALVQNAASAAQPAAAPAAAAGRALSESPGDIATSIVIGADGAQVELGNDVSGNILLRPAMTKAVAVNGSLTVSGSLAVGGSLTHAARNIEFNGAARGGAPAAGGPDDARRDASRTQGAAAHGPTQLSPRSSLPHYSRYDHANGALKSMRSHPMFQKLRAMKKQAAYGLGQSQIAANEAISGVKTDPSELKDEFKPGAA